MATGAIYPPTFGDGWPPNAPPPVNYPNPAAPPTHPRRFVVERTMPFPCETPGEFAVIVYMRVGRIAY